MSSNPILYELDTYFLNFLLPYPANPNSPLPRSIIVEGSGTGSGKRSSLFFIIPSLGLNYSNVKQYAFQMKSFHFIELKKVRYPGTCVKYSLSVVCHNRIIHLRVGGLYGEKIFPILEAKGSIFP